MITSAGSRLSNRFLASLPREDRSRLAPHLVPTHLRRGQVLTEAGAPLREVWFPHDAVVSFQSIMSDGEVAESGTLGSEGFVGFSGLLGSDIAISHAVVQVPGDAARTRLAVVQSAWSESEAFRQQVLLYIRAVLAQLSQSVACNALHSVEQRLARWLLMTHDRAGRDTFAITQEFIAEMLAVHRPTVTVVLQRLQDAKLIRHTRGTMTVLDRAGLEGAACECYGVVHRAFYFEGEAATKAAPG
jgi:CRP-like cAMP-binding protein